MAGSTHSKGCSVAGTSEGTSTKPRGMSKPVQLSSAYNEVFAESYETTVTEQGAFGTSRGRW